MSNSPFATPSPADWRALAEAALKNPLRKEIQKLAEQLHALSQEEEEASGKKGKKKRARK